MQNEFYSCFSRNARVRARHLECFIALIFTDKRGDPAKLQVAKTQVPSLFFLNSNRAGEFLLDIQSPFVGCSSTLLKICKIYFEKFSENEWEDSRSFQIKILKNLGYWLL